MALQFEHLDNAPWQLSLVWQSRLCGVSLLQMYQNRSSTDFLRHYGLLVDLKCKRLMDAETFLTVPTSYRRSTVSKLCVLVKNDCYSDTLNEFQEVTTPCIKKCHLLGKVEHHIETRCRRPVFARARLSPDKLATAKEEFKKLLEMDVIQPRIHLGRHRSTWWRNRPEAGELAEITER